MTTTSTPGRFGAALLAALVLPGAVRAQSPVARVTLAAMPLSEQSVFIDPSLFATSGKIEIAVKLKASPVVVAKVAAKECGQQFGVREEAATVRALRSDQAEFCRRMSKLSAVELARVTKALNAVILSVHASRLGEIARDPAVASIRRLRNLTLNLSETVPSIGAAALQELGVTGRGVVVAVIDTGIDYTHRNLGGPGTVTAYEAAANEFPWSSGARDGLFPTPKVIEGFDFVGDSWPAGDLAPDEDPIDLHGHGTLVADILAGASTDGTHKGVAPRASLLAIKACTEGGVFRNCRASGTRLCPRPQRGRRPFRCGRRDQHVPRCQLRAKGVRRC